MASATIDATIGGTTVSLLVVYPNNNLTDAELKAELSTVKGWFIAFNNDQGDIHGKLPSSTKSYPAAVMLATSSHHISASNQIERIHITGRISTAAAWILDKKENNCCVHIYTKNDTLADGYDTWLLKNKSASKLTSPTVQAKVAAALKNNRGTLGQDNLA